MPVKCPTVSLTWYIFGTSYFLYLKAQFLTCFVILKDPYVTHSLCKDDSTDTCSKDFLISFLDVFKLKLESCLYFGPLLISDEMLETSRP